MTRARGARSGRRIWPFGSKIKADALAAVETHDFARDVGSPRWVSSQAVQIIEAMPGD
jgi:hypothetical protein